MQWKRNTLKLNNILSFAPKLLTRLCYKPYYNQISQFSDERVLYIKNFDQWGSILKISNISLILLFWFKFFSKNYRLVSFYIGHVSWKFIPMVKKCEFFFFFINYFLFKKKDNTVHLHYWTRLIRFQWKITITNCQ